MKVKMLLATAAAVCFAAAFGAIRSVTPDMYGNRTNAWQLARHAEKMSVVTNGGAQVVFIGDSITHFWEKAGKEVWASRFAEGDLKALNLGISADRTEHVLWRIGEGGELDGYEAKCIVLMIGTNNTGHFDEAKETPIDTICGIREILKVIAKKQPKARTILCSIFPRGADAKDDRRRRNEVVNQELLRLCDGKKVIWCDFSEKFLDAEGNLPKELFPDSLHPSEKGYEIWADAVEPLIRKVLAAKPGEKIAAVGAKPEKRGGPRVPATRWDNNWWKNGILLDQRSNALAAKDGEFDIVWVGDSITHRWFRQGGEGRDLWLKIAEQYRMLNLGIGGDRTEHVLWRLRNGELEGYKAKVFTLMIGTNNGGTDVKGVAAAIKEILELIEKKHPESKIVLMPIFPRGDKPKGHEGNLKVNEIIKGYADGEKVLWLDFNEKFLNAEGKLTKEVMNDLLHPNAKGYEIWWAAIGPLFKELLGR